MIRQAKLQDASRIAELLYQVHDVHATIRPDLFIKGKRKYDEKQVEELIQEPNTLVFVIEEKIVLGYLIAFVIENKTDESRAKIKTLYIDDLCIDSQARHQHLGTQLLDYVTAYAKENGFYDLQLNVWEGNEEAKAFYEKNGMQVLKYGLEKKL